MHPESPQNPHKVSTSCSQTAAKPLLSCKASTGNTTAGKLHNKYNLFHHNHSPSTGLSGRFPVGPAFVSHPHPQQHPFLSATKIILLGIPENAGSSGFLARGSVQDREISKAKAGKVMSPTGRSSVQIRDPDPVPLREKGWTLSGQDLYRFRIPKKARSWLFLYRSGIQNPKNVQKYGYPRRPCPCRVQFLFCATLLLYKNGMHPSRFCTDLIFTPVRDRDAHPGSVQDFPGPGDNFCTGTGSSHPDSVQEESLYIRPSIAHFFVAPAVVPGGPLPLQ